MRIHYIVLIGLFFFSQRGFSQDLLTESFDYEVSTTEDLSTLNSNWVAPAGGTPIWVAQGSLSYPGLPASVGNKISFKGDAKEYRIKFAGQTSGTIYASFILSVKKLPEPQNGPNDFDYFISFANGDAANGVGSVVYIKASETPGKFNLGLGKRGNLGNSSWLDEIDFDTTVSHYIVFAMTAGSNQASSLWVDPAPGSLPEPDLVNDVGADFGSFNALSWVRFARKPVNKNKEMEVEVDELRIRTTWLELADYTDPSTPNDLVAAVDSDTQLGISWSYTAKNQIGFELQRSEDGTNFDFSTVLGSGTRSYADAGLITNKTYYYRIRTIGPNGKSDFSTIVNAVPSTGIPLSPTNLTGTPESATEIKLEWKDNSEDELGFEVERSTDNIHFSLVETLNPNVSTYTDATLSPSTIYYYRVRAIGDLDNSEYTNTVKVITLENIPITPTNLSAAIISDKAIELSWNDLADNEIWFELERSKDGASFTLLTTVPSNIASFTDNDLQASTQYYYRVRAAGIAGKSDYSNVVDVTTEAKGQVKEVEVQNLLSPNGDGKNDYWVIKNIEEYPANEVTVFDRNGRAVFQRKNYGNDWEGTYRGSWLPTGTYLYLIRLDRDKSPIKGTLTIIK